MLAPARLDEPNLPRELADVVGFARWLGPWWIVVLLAVALASSLARPHAGPWGRDLTPGNATARP